MTEADLSNMLRAMTDVELLKWALTPRRFDPNVNSAKVLLNELDRRHMKMPQVSS